VTHDGGLEKIGRNLVEKRLERVVVVLVDEHDLGVGVLQRLRCSDAREPTTEDDDAPARPACSHLSTLAYPTQVTSRRSRDHRNR